MTAYQPLRGESGTDPATWGWAKVLINTLNSRDSALGQAVAVSGMTSGYLGTVAPAGWLLRNGGVYPILAYPTLAALYGNTYGGVPGVSFATDTVPNSIVKT